MTRKRQQRTPILNINVEMKSMASEKEWAKTRHIPVIAPKKRIKQANEQTQAYSI